MNNISIGKIGVIGCGWLGMPLANTLLQKHFTVHGSTTNADKLTVLSKNGIVPFLIHLDDDATLHQLPQFLNVDLLIINVPPGRAAGNADHYLNNLNKLKNKIAASPIKNIIFISSTSVYAENDSTQTETSKNLANSVSAKRMLGAEALFKKLPNTSTTIIRMAGLIGPERHPGRFFAGKTNIPNGLAPVNLIHLDDCIGIIHKIIDDALWNHVFNAAAPTHPEKMKFYTLASEIFSGKDSSFVAEKGNFKRISSHKIISKGYQFKHPDLMEWLHEDTKK